MTSTSEQPTSSPSGPRRRSYRPAELIVAADAIGTVTRRLEQDGRRTVASSTPIEGLGLCKLTLNGQEGRLPVPALVRMLRAADPGLVIAPNRLLAPASHIIIRPFGPPGKVDENDRLIAEARGVLPKSKGVSEDGPKPRVGVIDTGYWKHPWFEGRVTGFRRGNVDLEADRYGRPFDVIDRDGNEVLAFGAGHGTFVAGCILMEAPQAEVIVRRVVVERPDKPDLEVDDLDLATAIIEVADSGVDILNLSVSTRVNVEDHPHEVTELLVTANAIIEVRQRRPDLIIVAPAGNDGPAEGRVWPAAFDTVIAVGARDEEGKPEEFSNRGEWVTASAPGEALTSTFLKWVGPIETKAPRRAGRQAKPAYGEFSKWATWSGTSFAAASVSGAIAAAMVTLRNRLPRRGGPPQLVPAREAAAALLYANRNRRDQSLGVPLLLTDRQRARPNQRESSTG